MTNSNKNCMCKQQIIDRETLCYFNRYLIVSIALIQIILSVDILDLDWYTILKYQFDTWLLNSLSCKITLFCMVNYNDIL